MKIRLVHPAIGEFTFPVEPGRPVILGRSGPDVDIEMNWDVRVSRRHARLWIDRGTVVLEDLNSKNGTWCGNHRLNGPMPLGPGAGAIVGETLVSIPDDAAIDLFLAEDTHSNVECAPLLQPPPTTPQLPPLDAPPWLALPLPAGAESLDPYAGEFDATPHPSGYVSTMDLRLQTEELRGLTPPPLHIEGPALAAPPRAQSLGPATAARAAAEAPRLPVGRFSAPDRVEVAIASPSEMGALWRDHLAKGGLFVETTEMRALHHRLEVTLTTPAGAVSFPALVVHASDAERARQLGVPPGLGLQAVELDGTIKAAIQAYAEGRSRVLDARPQAPQSPARGADVEAAMVVAKRVLDKLQKNEVYAAIDVASDASDSLVQERISAIAASLTDAARTAPPHKAARLEAALLALGRLAHALGDPLRRLEHDLTRGHIRAESRIAAAKAGQGPTLSELRRVWQHVAPEKVDRAALLTRNAFSAKQRGDIEEAIRAARSALEENPFFDELRPTLQSWIKQRDERGGLGPELPTSGRLRR